jgi:hypothetical protein
MPRVSVILPLYNKEAYIRRALDSVRDQTYSDFEMIVIDDGSTDGGARIAETYPDPRLRFHAQSNAGPGAARNRGVELAQGPVIAFLDGDDAWMPNYLAAGLAELDADPGVAAVTCGYTEFPAGVSTEAMWRRRGLRGGRQRVEPATDPGEFVYMLHYMTPCTTIARSDTIRRWGGFYSREKCRFGEDGFLWLQVLLHEPVWFTLSPRVHIHREASGLSKGARGPRPLEPHLQHPELIAASCPPELRTLLEKCLTILAFKAACFRGYWGDWKGAAAVRSAFRSPADHRLPYFTSSLVCSTPLGAALGALWRTVR